MIGIGLISYLLFLCTTLAAGTHAHEHEVDIQHRKLACRQLNGKCVKRRRQCPDDLPLETKRGKPYCGRRKRCCYPGTTTAITTEQALQLTDCPNQEFLNEYVCPNCKKGDDALQFCKDNIIPSATNNVHYVFLSNKDEMDFDTTGGDECSWSNYVPTWRCEAKDLLGWKWYKINGPRICVGITSIATGGLNSKGCYPQLPFIDKHVCSDCFNTVDAGTFTKGNGFPPNVNRTTNTVFSNLNQLIHYKIVNNVYITWTTKVPTFICTAEMEGNSYKWPDSCPLYKNCVGQSLLAYPGHLQKKECDKLL